MPSRYYVLADSCAEVVGFDDLVTAETAVLARGEGAYLVDTQGVPYQPSLLRVEGGRLLYMGLGHINHRQGLDANLIEGVQKGALPMVKAFLTKGADPNATDTRGASALLWAVASGNIDVVRLLLQAGAAVDRADADGITALTLAERQQKTAIAALLRAGGI
ncbi:MAG: ankyrin repeat-containing protein [Rhodospirillaceae bacterium]|nr:MAG: ankyrin repeat-containing protein [Rhodospirillaceae bacterium]